MHAAMYPCGFSFSYGSLPQMSPAVPTNPASSKREQLLMRDAAVVGGVRCT